MKKIILISLLLLSSIYAQKTVTVSLVPQKYFVEKIAKDKINVNVMVKAGFSPAIYEPKTVQMQKLSKSLIYFSVGVPFENIWLEKFKNLNPNILIVDTSIGIKKITMKAHHHGENHKKVEDHKKKILDPHIWLDPILVKTQAKNILDGLILIDKENKKYYYQNYKNFLMELDKIHQLLSNELKKVRNKKFMVFHPSWGYFAKRYNLIQEAVEKEGKEPKPKELISLIKEARKEGIKIVFIAPQFSKKSAEIIAKGIGGKVIVINPLSLNWEKSLIETAKIIVESYK